MAPLERLRRDRPLRRPHRPRGAGPRDGREPVVLRPVLGARRARPPGRDGDGDDRARAVPPRHGDLDRDRAARAALRALVLGAPDGRTPGSRFAWFHEIPTGGDINGAFHPNAETLLARPLLRDDRPRDPLPRRRPDRRRVLLPAPRRRGGRRGADRHLDPHHRPPRRPAARRGRGSSSCGGSSPRGYWWTSHPFSLSEAPDGRSLRISVKAAGDHTSRMRSIPVGTRVVAEGPYGAFTESAAAARQGAADRGRDRDHAGAGARRDDGGRHRRHLPRARRGGHRLRATSSPSSRAARPRACTTSSATTCRPRGATCSRPRTCASSFRTSPSGTCSSAARPQWSPRSREASVARASRGRLHVERFALVTMRENPNLLDERR